MSKRLFYGIVLVLFLLTRWPIIINPGYLSSDGAIVGLQAREMMAGTFELRGWERDYQTSFESLLLLPFYELFGATLEVQIWVNLLVQFLAVLLIADLCRRLAGEWAALVAVGPLLLLATMTSIYVIFGVRQWCTLLSVASVWVAIPAQARLSWARTALALGLYSVALISDLFAIQFAPPLALAVVLGHYRDATATPRLRRAAVAALVCIGAYVVTRQVRGSLGLSSSRGKLTLDQWNQSFPFFQDAFSFALGAKSFSLSAGFASMPNSGATPLLYGAAAILFALALSGGVAFFARRMAPSIRTAGVMGAVCCVLSVAAFCFNISSDSVGAARLFSPMMALMPLALLPVVTSLRGRWRLVAIVPTLMLALGSWRSYDGMLNRWGLPQRTNFGNLTDDRQLVDELRKRGVQFAGAEYWTSYRLALIAEERPRVFPILGEDRRPQWKEQFEQSSVRAIVSSSAIVPMSLEDHAAKAVQEGLEVERFEVGVYSAIVTRPKPP